ncbi:MAG: 16S rRNA (uracil(1498)-N(3))-methyltransferase [Christensenellaceae bacterium]|jgi:16S rRNA (uracil1498-N3)-methyltransferase|nr:16S rRNA (uracil(1498)-N(3))-methyltransferase [Christensenellaceae bacterium]
MMRNLQTPAKEVNRPRRFLAPTDKLEYNFELTGPEHHHLSTVTRSNIGDMVCCGNGEFDYHYEIIGITKNATSLRFDHKEPNTANPQAQLTVFMPLIKLDNLTLTVQKLNEIGVHEIVLFNAARCNVPAKAISIEKLRAIATQSCKQCGRSIPIKVSFGKIPPTGFGQIIFANEHEEKMKLHNMVFHYFSPGALIIGPEGGFTDAEREMLCKTKGVTSVSLGNRILRAETAAIVASAIILSRHGEL